MKRKIEVQLPDYGTFPTGPEGDAKFHEACQKAIEAAVPVGATYIGHEAYVSIIVKTSTQVIIED